MTPTIKTILESLDEMRSKATQGEWKHKNFGDADGLVFTKDGFLVARLENTDSGDSLHQQYDAEYIVALHNSFDQIRSYIQDLEREADAGRKLAEAVMEHSCDGTEDCFGSMDALLSTYRSSVKVSKE